MRVQVYPANNLIFVGARSFETDLSHLPYRAFAEFDSADLAHPYRVHIASTIRALSPKGPDGCSLPIRTTTIVERRAHNHFLFEEAGDVLPGHAHAEIDVHTSQVLRGAFVVETKEAVPYTINADSPILTWRPDEWHGFRALLAGSVLLNCTIHPQPEV